MKKYVDLEEELKFCEIQINNNFVDFDGGINLIINTFKFKILELEKRIKKLENGKE